MTSKQKFQKVMHEWKHGKLMSHGKKVTDQKQAIRIAFEEARKINSDYGMKADGGKLDSIYRTGTAKELWNSWDEKQRIHFLKDHNSMINAASRKAGYIIPKRTPAEFKKVLHEFSSENFIQLPAVIQREIVVHHDMGIYKEGSKIEDKKYVIRVGEIYDHSGGKAKVLRTYEEDGMPMVDYEFSNDEITKPETQTLRGFIKTIQNKYSDGSKIEGKLSPAKKKIQEKITKLQSAVSKIKSEDIRKKIKKSIDDLKKEFDYKPTSKELVQANKGKFALDVPTKYSKKVYRKLWSMNIRPRIMNMNGTSSIIVTDKTNLDKAYKVYADILMEEGKEVPALKYQSRKL